MIILTREHWFVQSKAKCERLISLAKPQVVKPKVVYHKTGRVTDSRFCIFFAGSGWIELRQKKADLNYVLFNLTKLIYWGALSRLQAPRKPWYVSQKRTRGVEKRIADLTLVPNGEYFTLISFSWLSIQDIAVLTCTIFIYRTWRRNSSPPLSSWTEIWCPLRLLPWWVQHKEWRPTNGYSS